MVSPSLSLFGEILSGTAADAPSPSRKALGSAGIAGAHLATALPPGAELLTIPIMENRDGATVVRLDGPLTVSTADATKARLMAALDRESFVVDCTGATEIDLSFVQLVIAARRSAELRGKTIELAAPAAGTLHDVLERCGLLGSSSTQGMAEAAFWTKGNVA